VAGPSTSRASDARSERVLIVDDSAVDRRLAGRLLEKDGFSPDYAENGRDALEHIARVRPDIVVTDLHMPELNGLELVEAIRKQYPSLPVVLMTAHGSEDIAVLALKTGAASFVPKRRLAVDLARTIDAIIGLSKGASERAPSDSQMLPSEREAAFVLENDVTRLPEIVQRLEAELSTLAFCDETETLQIGVALREAIVNAIYHGNLEVSSDLLDAGGNAFLDLVEARRKSSPYRDRTVELVVRYERDAITYTVTDQGRGFDVRALPDPTDPSNLEREHGRGVMLMRMFMDRVTHNEKGNVVVMQKRRPSRTG
jgi:CheY-like chemotaxis protein/anti-sigma regulatory factor (Ser/Thr protein kinase)